LATGMIHPSYLQTRSFSLEWKYSLLEHCTARKQCRRKVDHHHLWSTNPWPDPRLPKQIRQLVHLSKSLKCSQGAARQHWTSVKKTISRFRSSPQAHCPCSWNENAKRLETSLELSVLHYSETPSQVFKHLHT